MHKTQELPKASPPVWRGRYGRYGGRRYERPQPYEIGKENSRQGLKTVNTLLSSVQYMMR